MMRIKPRYATALLGAVLLAGGYYLRAQKTATNPPLQDFHTRRDKWFEEARKKLFEGSTIPLSEFDALFDDEFFGRRFDPFAEIEDFHKRMSPFLPERQRNLFGESWNDWFQDRMGVSGIRSEVKATDKEVVVSFKIPGLKTETLEVDVNDHRIRASYTAKVVEGRQDAGGVRRAESVRRFEKIMPIPAGADPGKRRIVREGDEVRIIFERRQSPFLKS